MTRFLCLSSREKKIMVAAGSVLIIFLIEIVCRVWGVALDGLKREERALKTQWQYAAGLLARSRSIDERDSRLRSSYPKLFEDTQDLTRQMAEFDDIAKAAGIQLTMLRPQTSTGSAERQSGSISTIASRPQIEMAFRGPWSGVMRFFETAEGRDHMFSFSAVSAHREERSGDLEISATVQK